MSDASYEEKVISQRLLTLAEMEDCDQCAHAETPSMVAHIAEHREGLPPISQRTAPPPKETPSPSHSSQSKDPPAFEWCEGPQSREQSPNADPTSLTALHPYKGPGVSEGAAMHKTRWSRPNRSSNKIAREGLTPADFDELERKYKREAGK